MRMEDLSIDITYAPCYFSQDSTFNAISDSADAALSLSETYFHIWFSTVFNISDASISSNIFAITKKLKKIVFARIRVSGGAD